MLQELDNDKEVKDDSNDPQDMQDIQGNNDIGGVKLKTERDKHD